MHRQLLPAVMLSNALALGCADQQNSLMAPASELPASSVDRGTVPFGFGLDDGVHVLFIGLTVDDLTNIACTGGEFDVDEVNELLVTRPHGSLKQQLKGNVNVVAFDLAAFEQFFCDDPSAVPTYTGIARLILNDSDVDITGPGADAAMMHVVGTVTDQSGQRYHLVSINQSIVSPEFTSPDDFEFTHSNIKIKLTPIGG